MATRELLLDELYCDTAAFVRFVREAKEAVSETTDRLETVRQLTSAFAGLLADPSWLPSPFTQPVERSGMGGGIASYLLYRPQDRSLNVSAMVMPAGAMTPVHDHLTWGLVGLYRGRQAEEVFRRVDDGTQTGRAQLELVERRHLAPGDFYELFPPDGDIHRVLCAPEAPSISIHVLGRDVGCVLRHQYDVKGHTLLPFRSGYTNAQCPETDS